MALGKTIVQLRMQKGLSQVELAQMLEIHPSQLNRWEKNTSQPRAQSLEKLATVLGFSVDELRAGDLHRVGHSLQELDDPELFELFGQVHKLTRDERFALKTCMKAMLTRVHVAEMVGKAG